MKLSGKQASQVMNALQSITSATKQTRTPRRRFSMRPGKPDYSGAASLFGEADRQQEQIGSAILKTIGQSPRMIGSKWHV